MLVRLILLVLFKYEMTSTVSWLCWNIWVVSLSVCCRYRLWCLWCMCLCIYISLYVIFLHNVCSIIGLYGTPCVKRSQRTQSLVLTAAICQDACWTIRIVVLSLLQEKMPDENQCLGIKQIQSEMLSVSVYIYMRQSWCEVSLVISCCHKHSFEMMVLAWSSFFISLTVTLEKFELLRR